MRKRVKSASNSATKSRHGTRALTAVALLSIVVVAPFPATALKPGAGGVSHGVVGCGKGSLYMAFQFRGRMPAGDTFYTVTRGNAYDTTVYCYGPAIGLHLVGKTPKGTFEWDCSGGLGQVFQGADVDTGPLGPVYPDSLHVGRILLYDSICTTVGYSGTFAFRAFLYTTNHTVIIPGAHEEDQFIGIFSVVTDSPVVADRGSS